MPRPKAKFLAHHAQSRMLAEPAPGSTHKRPCNDCRWSNHHIQGCTQVGPAPASRTRNGPASKQASESPMQRCAKQLMVWSPHPRLRTRIEQRAMHCKAAPSSRWSDHHMNTALKQIKPSRDLHETTADVSTQRPMGMHTSFSHHMHQLRRQMQRQVQCKAARGSDHHMSDLREGKFGCGRGPAHAKGL